VGWPCSLVPSRFQDHQPTCDRPCENACKRLEAGESIQVNALERACVDLADKRPGPPRSLPRKGKRVAVVGAGLSALTAAVDLAKKGYQVVVLEASARPGGRIHDLPEQVLSRQALDADFEVLQHLGVEVRYDSPVGNAEGSCVQFDALTGDFDAVYLGPGPGSVDRLLLGLELGEEGRIRLDPVTFATSHPKVFAGGGQRQGAAAYSSITSLQDGRYAALSIDRFLQKASLTASRDRGLLRHPALHQHQGVDRCRRSVQRPVARLHEVEAAGRRPSAASPASAWSA
jgi:NADPH-dependent glutamate synthase beta subunit-like oxidoreductase